MTSRDYMFESLSPYGGCSDLISARVRASMFGPGLFACTLVLALFILQGWIGFSLWDEGFLWYGVQRVLTGEVPIRDFMAYDPGRYYWAAAWMWLWGDSGILSLRGAVALFQALGLFLGLMLVARSSNRPQHLLCLMAAITMVVWMVPRHKLFDISASILLVGALSFLIAQPSWRRYFLTGVVVGLVALIGRNHGVYGVCGGLIAIGYLAVRRGHSPGAMIGVTAFFAGIALGYLPMLLLALSEPGYGAAFEESVRYLLALKATNLPLPIPWPWHVTVAGLSKSELGRAWLVGAFFVALPVFGIAGLGIAITARLQRRFIAPGFVASTCLALPYAHFAFSRADIGHLAQGVFPFLIGMFIVFIRQCSPARWIWASLLCGASLIVAMPMHPAWQCMVKQQCVVAKVASSELQVDRGTASDLKLLNGLAEKFAPGRESFIAAPYWPGAYAALERKSPMWANYALWARGEMFERAEIARIEAANPGFAIVFDYPLDGRDALRFSSTHPLVDRYIRDHFEPIIAYAENPAYQVYRRKSPAE